MNAVQNEITLYFYPSPGLSWKSPAALSFFTARNKLFGKARGIGHVSVRVRSNEGEPIELFTGMTQKDHAEGRHEVLLKGYGLGILFHDFRGELETPEKLDPELLVRAREGRLSYLRFETTRAAVERVERFIIEYRESGADQHYGMPLRPLFSEGGGCSAFAAGVLEVAGLLTDEFEREWTRRFLLPRSHIGGPFTGEYVGLWKTLFRMHWADPTEPHEELFFWDPDLMHDWLKKRFASTALPEGERKETWKGAPGIVRDARKVPVPIGPVFKGEQSALFHSIRHDR